MRITLVMASAEDGGLEKHVIELANGLSQEHKVSLIAHARFAGLVNDHINFVSLDMSGSRHNPWTKYQLKKCIERTNPDIVHAHASKTAQLMVNMVAKIAVPCLVTIHGAKSNLKHYMAFDYIIAVSQKLAQLVALPEKTAVVYNGVQLKITAQEFDKNRKFIAVGRLNEVKGFDVLIEAWQNIAAQLDIYGEGEEQAKLEQLIQHYQLQDRVRLCGFNENIHQKISQHEALIVSSHREGGPYTLAEALLLERPVLGTNVGMMAEFIDSDYLCTAGDVQELQTVIQHYLDLANPFDLYQTAFAQAQQQLRFDQMIEKTVQVYQSVLK